MSLFVLCTYWPGQRFLQGPTIVQACTQRISFETGMLCPVSQAHGCFLIRQQVCIARVSVLDCPGSPAAIGRAIPHIIFDAIQCQSCVWGLAHVCNKHCKLFPAFANGNPASTIVYIVSRLWLRTTGPHVSKDRVESRMYVPQTCPVTIPKLLASTTRCPFLPLPVVQFRLGNNDNVFLLALTLASPKSFRTVSVCSS
jgi:hypothetical protein